MNYLFFIWTIIVLLNIFNIRKDHFIFKMIFSIFNLLLAFIFYLLQYNFHILLVYLIVTACLFCLSFVKSYFLFHKIIHSQSYQKNQCVYIVNHFKKIVMYQDNGIFKHQKNNKSFWDLFHQNYKILSLDNNSCEMTHFKRLITNLFSVDYSKEHLIVVEDSRLNIKTLVLNITPIKIFNKNVYQMLILREMNKKNTNDFSNEFFYLLNNNKQGIFVMNLEEKEVFLNPALKTILHEYKDTISLDDFYYKFENNDSLVLKKQINLLNVKNPNFNMTCRIKVLENYSFFDITGTRLFNDEYNFNVICYIDYKDGFFYPKTTYQILNNLQGLDAFINYVEYLKVKKSFFMVCLFRLHKIDQINETYSYEVGNMVIADFLKRMNDNLESQNSKMFRLRGLDFIYVVTDLRKTEVLKQMLLQQIINKDIVYASMKLNVYPRFAITDGIYKNAQTILEECYEALNQALFKGILYQYYNDCR